MTSAERADCIALNQSGDTLRKDIAWVIDAAVLEAVAEERAKSARFRDALIAIADPSPEYFRGRGCSDGNCVIFRPSGMHTNGGCKCGTPDQGKRHAWAPMRIRKLMQDANEALAPKEPRP